MKTMNSPSSVRGLSLVGWILVIIVVVIFATSAIKMVPAYIDFNTISSMANSVLSDSKVGLKSENEIRADFAKRMSINNLTVISAQDLIIEKDGGTVKVLVDYEVRENLFSNVDVVMAFNREFTKDVR